MKIVESEGEIIVGDGEHAHIKGVVSNVKVPEYTICEKGETQ